MAWQGTLTQMKVYGTRLAQTASCRCAGRWVELNLDAMIATHGPEWMAWDKRPPCRVCGQPGHYMGSPGNSTPYRPLRTGFVHDAERRAFLLGFGFTRRDLVRIRAMAERTTANYSPAALNDLDVPYRIGAVWPGGERHSSGQLLGDWAGRTLLYWEMVGREREVWAGRRPGPRRV